MGKKLGLLSGLAKYYPTFLSGKLFKTAAEGLLLFSSWTCLGRNAELLGPPVFSFEQKYICKEIVLWFSSK